MLLKTVLKFHLSYAFLEQDKHVKKKTDFCKDLAIDDLLIGNVFLYFFFKKLLYLFLLKFIIWDSFVTPKMLKWYSTVTNDRKTEDLHNLKDKPTMWQTILVFNLHIVKFRKPHTSEKIHIDKWSTVI